MNQSFIDLDPIYFVLIGGVLGLLAMVEGLRQSIFGANDTAGHKSRRLRMMAKGQTTEILLSQMRNAAVTSRWHRLPFLGNIPAKMRQAGMVMKPRLFLTICFGISALVFLLGLLKLPFFLALGCGITTGLILPVSIINIKRTRRIEEFARQLPDALDLMKRGLSVGHPLNVTIANVARTMADPIGTEFGLMADQISYGDSLTHAMNELARRIDQEDMHYLAASVSIQHGSGGNLGTMLATLGTVIRRRYAMRRKIRAVSSEGRLSAMILSGLPFLMYGVTSFTAPDYYASVSGEPLFKYFAIAVVVLVVGNAVLMRKLVTFRI